MRFVKPKTNEIFTITSAPAWPSLEFETDATGPHKWQWTIEWGTFKKTGTATTPNNKWNAMAVTNYGGTLTVRAEADSPAPGAGALAGVSHALSKGSTTISVKLKGTNPSAAEVNAYLATKSDSAGFEKIIEHEANCKHFNAASEPIKSFDGGYGMCQLTNPTPTFEQVWNWKQNIDGGLKLFAQKRTSAIAYLTQSGRSYTGDQLKYEAVCRWNGGAYHEWDAKGGAWVRPSHILCDSKTGNIGWDMNHADNKGKTEAELRKRDSASYSKPPTATAHWKYLGVCYADRVLG
jgi:hypothetical protein